MQAQAAAEAKLRGPHIFAMERIVPAFQELDGKRCRELGTLSV